MKRVNLHISTHNSLSNPSRILKETKSLIDCNVFDEIIILGRSSPDLPVIQKLDSKRKIIRLGFWLRYLSILNIHFANSRLWVLVRKVLLLHRVFSFFDLISINLLLQFLYFKNISCINIHSYDHILWGVKLKKRLNSKLIYDIHELESQRAGLSCDMKSSIFNLEKKYINEFDLIICVSNDIRRWYLEHHINITEIIVVRNIPAVWQQQNHKFSDLEDFRKIFNIEKSKIVLLYNGGFSNNRGILILLNLFESFSEIREKFTIIFMGYGPLEDIIKKASTQYNSIKFFKAVPPEKIINYTRSVDLGISIFRNVSVSYDFALPNKLFEYLLAGIGIIGGITKTQKKFILDNNLGLCAKKESLESYYELFRNISHSDIEKFKQNAKDVQKKLSWDIEVQDMIKTYKNLFS
jgi:glycosyltransferase involved in cell wall biosynthesis